MLPVVLKFGRPYKAEESSHVKHWPWPALQFSENPHGPTRCCSRKQMHKCYLDVTSRLQTALSFCIPIYMQKAGATSLMLLLKKGKASLPCQIVFCGWLQPTELSWCRNLETILANVPWQQFRWYFCFTWQHQQMGEDTNEKVDRFLMAWSRIPF